MAKVIHGEISEPADIGWDVEGKFAVVHFLAKDLTSISVSMSPELLETLRAEIVRAQRARPASNPHR